MLLPTSDCHEFEGCDGKIHSFQSPSAAGAIEFHDRLSQLSRYMADHQDDIGSELYQSDKRFRWLVDRCLELNHIETHWVSWPQIERLLFGWIDEDGEPQPAILVQIQRSDADATGGDRPALVEPEALTVERLVASLALSQGGIEAATRLVNGLTTKQLSQIIAAQTKASAPTSTPVASTAFPTGPTQEEGLAKLRERMLAEARESGANADIFKAIEPPTV